MIEIGILVKPDTHQRGIYKTLLNEFISRGYSIQYEQDTYLTNKDIKFLYPVSYSIPAGRKALLEYLKGKKSTIVLFKVKNEHDAENETKILHKIKGKKELKFGLRYKYNNIPITDYELTNKTGNYYSYMTINLFHVFDDQEQINYFKDKNEQT